VSVVPGPWVVALSVLLLAIVLAGLVIGLSLAAKRLLRNARPANPAEPAPPPTLRVATQLAKAELQTLARGRKSPDEAPWILALGAPRAALAGLLPPVDPAATSLATVGWADAEGIATEGALTFHRHGVVVAFEDGLAGAPLWERRLAALLGALDRARPERPLDGLAVVVQASSLWSVAEPAAGSDADAAALAVSRQGEALYEVLRETQRRSGWRLPIHLLVTGCDEVLPGFAEWLRATAEPDAVGARASVLGWTPPTGLDAAFDPAWTAAAVDSMAASLTRQQLALMMRHDADGARLFLLPQAVRRLEPGLRALLDSLLHESVYHEAFMFRGVYLVDGAPHAAPGAAPAPTSATARAADPPLTLAPPAPPAPATVAAAPAPLARQVFDTRIFAERRLAQPAFGEMTRRHRLVRSAQAAFAASVFAAVVGLVGLEHFVARHFPPIEQMLEGIDRQVKAADRAAAPRRVAQVVPTAVVGADRSFQGWVAGHCHGASAGDADPVGFTRADREGLREARDLLALMSRVDSDGADTAWALTTRFDPLNARVRRAVDVGYRAVVCRALLYRMGTLDGIDALLAPPRADMRADEAWLDVVANAGRFDLYYRELGRIRDRQHRGRELVASFREVAGFVLGIELPRTFNADYRIYGGGIAENSVPRFRAAQVQTLFETALVGRFAQALEAHYDCRPLTLAVLRVADTFRATPDDALPPLEAPEAATLAPACATPLAGPAAPTSEDRLRLFLEDYDTIAARGAIPGRYDWVFHPDRDPGAPGAQLAALEKLDLASDSFVADLRRRALDAAGDAGVSLRSANIAGVPILAEVQGRPQPSRELTTVRAYVADLLAQPFMAQVDKVPAVSGADGPVDWDLKALGDLQDATEAFLIFSAPASPGIPPPVQTIVRQASAERFPGYARVRLAAAARPMPVGDDAEAAAFAQAAPYLVSVRNTLRQARTPEALALANQLDLEASRQAERILRAADARLRAQNAYALSARGLQGWSGVSPLGAAAFGAASPDELKAELAQRRAVLAVLARDPAGAAASFLRDPATYAESASGARLAAQWEDLRNTLQAYEAGRPGNGLARLEQFISVDLDQLRAPSCRLPPAPGASGYFAEQIRDIRQQALSRCAQSLQARYDRLAYDFNRTLAGRFPFAGAQEPATADPEAVRDFFAAYGDDLPAFRAALADGSAGRAAVRFLADLTAARDALAPMLAGPPDAPLAYRVAVDFFTDAPLSRGQDQVIEAVIGPPASRATSAAAEPAFVWANGQPLDVALRWAADAPGRPLAAERWPLVDGATARFRVDGDWALLRLLRRAAPSGDEAAGLASRRAAPVRFAVPLAANPQRATGGDPATLAEARVYLRLAVRAAGGPPAAPVLALPPFPTAAPAFGRDRP
jgi:hypothetical protein